MSDKHVKRQRQRPHNSAAAGFVAIPPELDAAAGSASPLVAQLGRVAAVGAAQEQVRELKVLATALQAAESIDEASSSSVAAGLAALLFVPHPFSFHSQLKSCVAALAAASPAAQRALEATLEARLGSSLLALGSLAPGGAALPGVLREGTLPGWLPLLLDVDAALPLLRRRAAPLVWLVARSLSDALAASAAGANGAAPAAPCVAALELSKLQLVLLRVLEPELRGARATVAADAAAARARVAAAAATAADDVGGAVQLLADASLLLVLAPSTPAETALGSAHLLCCLTELGGDGAASQLVALLRLARAAAPPGAAAPDVPTASVFALAVGNGASALLGGFGGCGLIPQTVLNLNSGGGGRLSSLAYAAAMATFVVALAPLVGQISQAALAGLMISVAFSTVQWAPTKAAIEAALAGDGDERAAAEARVSLAALLVAMVACYEVDFAAGIAIGVAVDVGLTALVARGEEAEAPSSG